MVPSIATYLQSKGILTYLASLNIICRNCKDIEDLDRYSCDCTPSLDPVPLRSKSLVVGKRLLGARKSRKEGLAFRGDSQLPEK